MTNKKIKELQARNVKIEAIIKAKLSRAEMLMFNEYVENELVLEAECNK
jgi:hypothetical protein